MLLLQAASFFIQRSFDFGIQTSSSPAGSRTITVSNLGTTSQTFSSVLDAFSNSKTAPASPFSEVSSDCTTAGAQTSKILAPGGSCHITIGLTASSSAASDGLLQAEWSIGGGDVLLMGYSQAAMLSVSASEIDFGTQFSSGIHLPRYLYLSNASASPVSHAALTLPSGSAFTLIDGCPAVLLPATVCRIRIDYLAAQSTSTDSATLALDQGLSVLITGKTLPPHGVAGATVNPNLSVTPSSITFAAPTVVTGVSSTTQTVAITNSGTSTFSLTLALTGDFTDATSCGATLAGGQTCAVVLTFAPSQPGSRSGLLSITAGAGTSPAYVTLNGTGTAILPANNGTLDSGSVPIGQPSTLFYKIAQPFSALTLSTTGPYTVTLVEDVGYGHGSPTASAFLASGTGSCHNCFLGVRFQPTAAGSQPGTLTLSSASGGTPYTLTLMGTGLSLTGLVLTPPAQDFGSAPVNSSSGSVLFTLTNLSALGTSVSLANPVVTGDFALTSAATGGPACGGTVAYTASCFVEVVFTPTAVGTRTGTLTFSSSGASVSATLTGLASADSGLGISPLALAFNDVPGSSSTQQTVTLTNTGSQPLQIGTPSPSPASFQSSTSCTTLSPGASCSISVTFQPASASVSGTLAIPVTSPASGGVPQTSTYMVSLNGAYTTATAGLEIVPGEALYGPAAVGTQTVPRLFTINNLTAKSLTLSIAIPRQFVLLGSPCTSLAPNGSCSFSVALLPLTNGDLSGTINAQATPSDGSPALTSLAYAEGYGVGAGSLSITGGLIANGIFNFGQVTSGQALSQTFTVSNASGSPAITIRRVTSEPPFFSTTTCGTVLAASQTCSVTVTYTPSNQVSGTAAAGSTTDAGVLTIESDAASSPNLLNLTGQAGPIAATSPGSTALATFTLSQSSLTFTAVAVGNASPAQTITLVNTGSVALHVNSVSAPADFSVQSSCAAVARAATCTIMVSSTPQTSGTHAGALEISSDSATSLEFISLLSGATPSPLTLAPSSLDFGSVTVGASAVLQVQVTNTTASPITFISIATSGDYSASGNCPAAGSALAANTSCTVQVAFSPVAAGARTGLLSVATSASTFPLTVSLTGMAPSRSSRSRRPR